MEKETVFCSLGCFKDVSKKKYCSCKKKKLSENEVLTLKDVPKLTLKNLPF